MNFLESRLAYFEESFESRNSTSSKEITPDQKIQIVNDLKLLPDIVSFNEKINEICALYPNLGKGQNCIENLGLTEFYNTLKNKNNTGSVVDTNKNLTPIVLNEKTENKNTFDNVKSQYYKSELKKSQVAINNINNKDNMRFNIHAVRIEDFNLQPNHPMKPFLDRVVFENNTKTTPSISVICNRLENYFGFPPNILLAIAFHESMGKNTANDGRKSVGFMQLQPKIAAPAKRKPVGPLDLTYATVNRNNPLQSLLRAAELLYTYKAYFYRKTLPQNKQALIAFQNPFYKPLDPYIRAFATDLESFRMMLTAYNAGHGAVNKRKKNPYADKVLAMYDALKGVLY